MAIAVGRRSYALPQIFFAWNLNLPQWCMCWIHINNILISKSVFWGLLWEQWKPPPTSNARNMLIEETENLLQDELLCYGKRTFYSLFFSKREKKRYNSREVRIIKDVKNVVEMLKASMQWLLALDYFYLTELWCNLWYSTLWCHRHYPIAKYSKKALREGINIMLHISWWLL